MVISAPQKSSIITQNMLANGMGKKPVRKSHLYSVENVLQSLLQNGKSALAQGFTRFRLEKEWPKIVGESISKNTVPCALEKGTLFVWVSHPTWMQQLVYFKDVIKEKVNTHLGYPSVYEVKFTLDRRAAKSSPEVNSEPNPEPNP